MQHEWEDQYKRPTTPSLSTWAGDILTCRRCGQKLEPDSQASRECMTHEEMVHFVDTTLREDMDRPLVSAPLEDVVDTIRRATERICKDVSTPGFEVVDVTIDPDDPTTVHVSWMMPEWMARNAGLCTFRTAPDTICGKAGVILRRSWLCVEHSALATRKGWSVK